MKLKLNVIKLNNEDVIATSCGDAIYSFKGYNSEESYIKGEMTEGEYFQLMSNYYGSEESASVAYVAAMDENVYYHVLSNGKIEKCNNPSNHRGTGWAHPSY